VEWNTEKGKFYSTDQGVPQGGIISPLLSNLVLNELDSFIEKLIKERAEINKNIKPHLSNPLYQRLSGRISSLKRKRTGDKRKDRDIRRNRSPRGRSPRGKKIDNGA
jgi:retron-type reverse transcriptase